MSTNELIIMLWMPRHMHLESYILTPYKYLYYFIRNNYLLLQYLNVKKFMNILDVYFYSFCVFLPYHSSNYAFNF